jgi:CelD/BcsL family acetyltransferase involved in cellulose biosynthesis
MRLVVHREIPENDVLRRQWNNLVQRMECPEVFYTYEWARAVALAYRNSLQPLLVVGYEGDCVAGIASLAIDLAQKHVTFLAATTADYCDFVCAPDKVGEFTCLVLSELGAIASKVVLASVPVSSATGHALRESARQNNSSHFSRPSCQCAQTKFASPQQRDSVRRSMKSKRFERQDNRLSLLGPVTVRHITQWPEIAVELPKFRKAHVDRFCALGRTSNLADQRRWSFLQELAQLLSGQGWMVFSVLSVGGQPVAWNYGFRFSGSWFWYQPGIDESFSRRSSGLYPGLCLLARMIAAACDMPDVDRVDLGLGEEGYKERFATDYCDTMDVTLSQSTLHHVREQLCYRAASAIKSSPHVEQCVRWLLRRPTPNGARA